MKYEVVDPRELSADLVDRWASIRRSDASYYSPFFSYDFVQAMAEVRPQTSVLVAMDEQLAAGFLAFEKQGRIGFPASRMINDAHGFLGNCDAIQWQQVMQAMDVMALSFHAHPKPTTNEFHQLGTSNAFLCDFSAVEKSYSDWLKNHSRTIAKQKQKTNKLIREIGPLTLVVCHS